MSHSKYSAQQEIYRKAGRDPEAEMTASAMKTAISDVRRMNAAERAEFAYKVENEGDRKP